MLDKAQSIEELSLKIIALESVPPAALASASRLIEADDRFNTWCAQGKRNKSFPGVDFMDTIFFYEAIFHLCRVAVEDYLVEEDADRLRSSFEITTGKLNDYVDRHPLTR